MIVLDTTVLVHAVGAEHPLREPCRQLIGAIAAGRVSATTTVEVPREFAHVRARRRDRHDAALRARDYLDLLAPLLLVGDGDLRAATAARANATALVSADRAFAEADVAHVFPDAAGVARLLRD